MSMSEFIMTRNLLNQMQDRINLVSTDEEPLNYSHQISDISTFGADSYVVNPNNSVIWDELAFKSNYLFGHTAIHDVVYDRLTEENIDKLYKESGYIGRQLNNFHSTERYHTGNADDVFSGMTIDGYNKLEDKLRWGFQRHADRKMIYKNLVHATQPTFIINRMTFENDGNGSYVLNGTASAGTYVHNSSALSETFTLRKGKKYQVFGCYPGGSHSTYRVMLWSYTKNDYIGFDLGNGETDYFHILTSDIDQECTVMIWIEAGVTLTNAKFTPSVVELEADDETDMRDVDWTSYDKFTKSLPTPAFASGITEGGLTVTDNNDGSYTVAGVCNVDADYAYFSFGKMHLTEGSILTGCPNGGAATTFWIQASNTANNIVKPDYGDGVSIEQTLDYDIHIVVKNGTAIEDEFRPVIRNKVDYNMFGKKKIGKWLNDVYGVGVSEDCTLETIVGNKAVWDKVLVSEPCMTMLTSSDTALDYMANSLVALERFADAIYYAGQNGKAINVIGNYNDLINTVVKDEVSMHWIANNEDAMKTILANENFTRQAVESEVAMSTFANSEIATTLLLLYAANNQININSYTSIDGFLASMNVEIAKISQVVDSAPQSELVLATRAAIASAVAMLDDTTKNSKVLNSNITAIVENTTFMQQAFSNRNIMDIIFNSKDLLLGLYQHASKVMSTTLAASPVFWDVARASQYYRWTGDPTYHNSGAINYPTLPSCYAKMGMTRTSVTYTPASGSSATATVYTKNVKCLYLGFASTSDSSRNEIDYRTIIRRTIGQSEYSITDYASAYDVNYKTLYPPKYKMADFASSFDVWCGASVSSTSSTRLVLHWLEFE